MLDARSFQREFGTALAGIRPVADPVLARALAVHRNTATKAAADAIAANFPVVAALVGDEPFAAVAHAFVDAHPPKEPRLCLYGECFPGFLATWEPFSALAYLPDVARIERLVVEALFAADAVPLAPDAVDLSLDAVPALHPALAAVAFDTPAVSIWLAHQPDSGVAGDGIDWAAEIALVVRPHGSVTVIPSPGGTAAFVEALREGHTLGTAAAAAGDELAAIFSTLIAAGAFVPAPSIQGAIR